MRVLAVLLGLFALVPLAGALATFVLARQAEARFPPNGRFVDVPGGRLHVMETGPPAGEERATVLLLHGASGSGAEPMTALASRLAPRFRVVAIDRPGHGWSDRIAGPAMASPARQADVIAEALRALAIDRAIVVGHSWSGALALNLALDHPERVAGLVLLAPVSHPWPGGGVSWYYGPSVSPLGWLLTRTVTTPLTWLGLPAGIRTVFAPQAPPPDYIAAARMPLLLRPPTFRANAQDVAGLYAFVAGQHRRYKELRLPTTVIAGDRDRIVWTDVHARGLARDVPGAKLLVLPGIGHMPHHAAPDLVAAEIAAIANGLVP